MSPSKTLKNPCNTPWQRKWLGLDCHRPEIQALAEKAEKFCGRWYRNEPSPSLLVLVGESGCGKTHVAAAILRFAYAAGFQAAEQQGWPEGGRVTHSSFVSWPEATDSFKTGDYSAVGDALTCGLLVLDDIGAEQDPSKNAADKLCQILTNREKRFTVVTTNIKLEDWPAKFDSRIADRLMRNSQVVSLFGLESYAMI